MADKEPNSKKKLSTGTRIALVYILSLVIGIFLASSLSQLYINIFKPKPYLGFGDIGDFNNLLDGFLIGYSFFLSLFSASLLENKKTSFWVWLIGIAIFLVLLLGEWNYFGFVILLSLIGYAVGLGARFLYQKVKPS